VKTTNLPWVIEAQALAKALGLESVRLLNDLEAIARAVPILRPDDLVPLNTAAPLAGGAIAVIAPGTGLGEAFLTWDGSRYVAHASEGGQADFAPTDASQTGLLQHLRERYGHVSVERVSSGMGIPNIYDYLRDTHYASESSTVAMRLAGAADRTPIIVEAALHPTAPCKLCIAALDTFVAILGAEAGNLALKVLSTGGVYLAGGIPMRILPLLTDGRFMQAFQRKGRFADLLVSVPVHVIVKRAALLGAARFGLGEEPEKGTRAMQLGIGDA
jgi:glucokinase